ncbi:hypothetical protein NOCA230046 [metagenome]|uniref:Uncharacterized protein n=1 Tax=metagenome TaxID=256318 RepID=A0A2P2C153_9ZZZZ
MTTAHALVQQAVRRDLERARILLSTQLTITKPRRQALAHHLIWLFDMVHPQDDDLAAAKHDVHHGARAFFASAERVPRRDLLLAVGVALDRLAERDDWIHLAEIAHLGRQVHWLVDGLESRVGDHVTRLLNPRANLPRVRLRGEVYRYRKDLLWGGTPAYTKSRPSVAG